MGIKRGLKAAPVSKYKERIDRVIINSEQLRQLETMAGLGLSWEKIATILNMHVNTMEKCRKRQPEIDVAFNKGLARSSLSLRSAAHNLAVQDKNPRMLEFLLKTREGFRETQRVEHVVADQSSLAFQAMPIGERHAEIEKLLAMRELCAKSKKVER